MLLKNHTIATAALLLLLQTGPALGDESGADIDEVPELEEVVVEAARADLTVVDIPVNTSVLARQDILELSTRTVDEILRQVPGFNLLRSADSIATSPSTSTVSLRGLGGNAASRTLVLLDGVPINNPYTSEVYWARVPKHRIERIEVVRGGGANAWGNLSLGGVINIVTEKPREGGLDFTASAGDPETVDVGIHGSHVRDRWSFSGGIDYFDTDGYMNIPAGQAGPIDENVWKEHGSVSGRVEHRFSDRTRVFLGGSWFEEDRGAGSPLDVNSVEIRALETGLETVSADGSRWNLNLFYDDTTLDDNSVRINSARDDESLRSVKHQPTSALGSGLVWSREFPGNHLLTAGADYRWTDITVRDWRSYSGDTPRRLTTTRAEQDLGGLFVQDNWQINDRWQANGSLRYDYVTNKGSAVSRSLTSNTVTGQESYASNSETTVNPSLGTVYRPGEQVSFRAAAYKGFRAATLRELYRSASTRSGVNLVNNPELAPERLVGLEAGADLFIGTNATLRLTLFRNTVEDLIQNITRGETGDLPGVIEPCGLIDANETCRELDNVGEMRATGLEVEADWQPAENWELQLSYLYNDTEITKAPDDPQLVGKQVRQAPEHSATLSVRNSNRWFDTSLMARYVGERYEDDLNRLEVDDFLLFDLRFSRRLSDSTELFLAVENLFDEAYEIRVENNGSIETGRPRFVGLGLRYRR